MLLEATIRRKAKIKIAVMSNHPLSSTQYAQRAHAVLKQYWGYDSFRPQQLDIVLAAMNGRDTLALLPTGGGKSICFQVPALAQEGVCVVVSPLIALMQDQVQNLKKRGIAAEAIHTGMHARQIDRILDNAVHGAVKFLYLSPERLQTDIVQERLPRMQVNLIAVDEAHCISQWGYDFRPAYLEIAQLRELLPQVPVLALTATATPQVVTDIQERLAFKAQHVIQQSFARSNLAYLVIREEDKLNRMLDMFRKMRGSGIVYVRNRRKTQEIAHYLQKNGVSASFYHAGLSNEVRTQRQADWVADRTRVMVATNAFGMGIDKPDVRLVVHLSLPDSLEAYFQEAGRAGRDGQKSFAALLYHDSDREDLMQQAERAFPPIDFVKRVYNALGSYFQLAVGSGLGERFDFQIQAFAKRFDLDLVSTFSALKLLERTGWIAFSESVFTPASLHIKVDKETLYDYQLRNPRLDPLIKLILRSTQGAMQQYVRIKEYAYAQAFKTSREAVVKALQRMQQDNIIDYTPQNEAPQVIYLQPRTDVKDLRIDHRTYQFLRERQAQRVAAAIAYATEERCRSQQLLAYFGEHIDQPCGECDVELRAADQALSAADLKRVGNHIYKLLRRRPYTIQEIARQFPFNWQNRVLLTVEHLLEQEMVRRDGQHLHWIAHTK